MAIHSILSYVALPLVLMGTLASPSLAQDRLELTSGRTYSGKVLSEDGTTVEFKTSSGATLKFPIATLTVMSQYRLKHKSVTDDVDSQLDLADWCVDVVLYEQARRHFDAALAADSERSDEVNARLDAARTKAGRDSMARAQAMIAAGHDKDARELLGKIMQQLPMEPVAEEAAAMLENEKGRRKAEIIAPEVMDANEGVDPRAGKHATRPNGKLYSNRARKIMSPTVALYYTIIDRTHEGLVTNSRLNAIELYTAAIGGGPKIMQAVEDLQASAEKDQEIADALVLLKQKTEEVVVSARMHLVQTYLIGNQVDEASQIVLAGLADYPQNTRLLNLEQRVTNASASGRGAVILGRRRDS